MGTLVIVTPGVGTTPTSATVTDQTITAGAMSALTTLISPNEAVTGAGKYIQLGGVALAAAALTNKRARGDYKFWAANDNAMA